MSHDRPPGASPEVCVARQPILDLHNQVFGYEVLYRAARGDTTCNEAGDQISARVLITAVLSMGLETLTGGTLAFLNVSHQVLLEDVVTVLPPDGIVVEILENIPITDEVVDMCRSLQSRGYALALDDFTPGCPAEALLPFAQYVKVDLLLTAPEALAPLVSRLRSRGLCVLAEKVETAAVLEAARAAGCSLFQGYFFCRPTTHTVGALPPLRIAYLRLLAALNQPTLTLAKLEGIIKQDASFSYRVLRSANSAASSRRQQVHSIHDALLLMGQDRVRKWASIWAMAGVGEGAVKELVTLAVLRARCCELLGETQRHSTNGSDHFLLGLCSLLDVILGRPMDVALEDLPLSAETRAALLGAENPDRHMLDAVVAYERGAWEVAQQAAALGGIASRDLSDAYTGALAWAWALTQGDGS